jgi:predicted RNase H-like nuclease (RuvC/YqgF family)
MRRLISVAAAIVLTGIANLAWASPAADKPSPFARFDKKIADLTEKIEKLDAEKDKKKIEALQKQLEKERVGKDKSLEKMLTPFEAKLEKLEAQLEKAKEQGRPVDKIEQEIKATQEKIDELEDVARPPMKDDADGEQVDDAAKKSKDALKGMM